jgi:iron complex transport system substrate-binding protein
LFNSHHTRQRLIVPLLLLLVVLVSACGNSGTNGNNQSGSPIAASPTQSSESTESQVHAEVEADAVKTVTTVNGNIEIPVHPKRIVAEEYLGSLIALDVIPVGAPGLTLKNYYFKEALMGVEDTGTYGQVSPEKLIALEPDLIISGAAESYDQLSKIAPTIIIPYGTLKNAHEELTYFGELMGKEKEAKAWLSNYDQQIAAAKVKVDKAIPVDATFSILEVSDKSIWTYGDNFGRGGQPVFQALGRKPPAAVADEIMEKQWAELSAELLEQYAGDYLVVTSNKLTLEDLKADPIWSKLPAMKNDQVYVWPEERSWYYDPIAVLAQTAELTDWLAGGN